jgi:hypothetical protein
MNHCARFVRVLALLTVVLSLPVTASLARAEETTDASAIVATYTFPDIALASLQGIALPDHPIANDRGMLLGGVGSDLWHVPDAPANELWMVTDRGPNDEIEVDDEDRRTFPVPDFTPLILHVSLANGGITVLEAIPIVNRDGEPVTGLPNLEKPDEAPFNVTGEKALDFDQDGLDIEGMVRTPGGEFWVAEEYRPSLVKIDPTGRVLARYVPEGIDLPDADYPVHDTLPAIYGMRKENRGFEGLALSDDGQTLFAVVQSPLSNPTKKAGEASRNSRILAVNTATGEPVAEYVYRFQDVAEFGDDDQDEMKLSGLVWIDPATLLALERTDEVARLYRLDLAGATNILGTAWDDRGTSPTLEELDDPAAAGAVPLAKTLLLDLAPMHVPEKIEGVAVVDTDTIALANDNDFAIGDFVDGENEGTGVPSQVLIVHTPPMP